MQGFYNFLKMNIGIGILSISHAIKETGYKQGLFILIVTGLISTYCVYLLIRVVDDM